MSIILNLLVLTYIYMVELVVYISVYISGIYKTAKETNTPHLLSYF